VKIFDDMMRLLRHRQPDTAGDLFSLSAPKEERAGVRRPLFIRTGFARLHAASIRKKKMLQNIFPSLQPHLNTHII
jgi:hypothetical protein